MDSTLPPGFGVWAAASLLWLTGCGGAASQGVNDDTVRAQSETVNNLEAVREAQAAEIQELESRLALARAEASALRAEKEVVTPGVRQTVRLGAAARRREEAYAGSWQEPFEESADEESWREPLELAEGELEAAPPADEGESRQARSRGPRPLLRLHGAPGFSPGAALGALPALPTSTPLRMAGAFPALQSGELPRATVASGGGAGVPRFLAGGWAPVSEAAVPTGSPTPSPESVSPAVTAYRAALREIRDQHFGEALRRFDDFLARFPSHPYAQHALYWRGEALYARRAYREAQTSFDALLQRFPRASKAPDALLKLALCQWRLGHRPSAQQTLAQLRRSHPDSIAARSGLADEVVP